MLKGRHRYCFSCDHVNNDKFSWWGGQFLHFHTTFSHYIWSTHWTWRVHVSQACLTWPWPHFHGLQTLLILCQVFVIRSVSPLPYNLGSLCLVHTLIMKGTCQSGMCHLTLTVQWFNLFYEKHFKQTICKEHLSTLLTCYYLCLFSPCPVYVIN